MQKRLLFIACLLLAIVNKMVAANGVDQIAISDFSIYSGQSKEIAIELTNTETYVGFQFDLQLPQGFTVDTCSANANRIPDGTSLRMSQQTDGSYRFVAAALDGSEITGNSGTVVNITVTAGQNLTEGSYTGYIRDIKLSRADGTGTIVSEEQPFTITVSPSSYRVMIAVEGNGEVSYSAADIVTGGNEVETTVDAGGSLELIFFPAEGNKLSQVMVDDTDVTAQVTTDSLGVISYTLTNIYDNHDISVVFASLAKVDTPIPSWSSDQLTLTTATEGASIYYTNSADIAQGGEGTVTPGGGNGTLYEGPITISADAQITAWAVKEEMINSDTLYIDYPYTAWQTLLSAISTGQTVLSNAERSTRVSDDMKTALSSLIAEAEEMYGVRTATESVILDKAREINELAEEMQRIIDQVEEAYAALSDNNTVLTFYYDYDKSTRNGMTLAFYAYEPSDRGWNDNAGMITKVVFDESFANYQPTSTANWLSGLSSLTSIEGMSYLKTDSVTNMWNMFGECVSLTSIDLSGFKTGKVENMGDLFGGCSGLTSLDVSYLNTENVVNMQGMFRGCSSLTTLDLSGFKTDKVSSTYSMFSESSNLKTIYVGSGWNTTINPSSEYMFLDCVSLVGGAGTVYSHDHNDFTYAHIDGGVDNPGYLTSIADTAAVAPVTFSRNMFELTLSCATPNVTIMYAIPDNETGEMTWQTYTTPLTLTGDCTVHAYAIRPNGIRSAETSYTFRASDVQQAETPTFAWIGDQLTLTTATEGASIYYTNSADATGETLYEGPVTITADALITAWAVKEGMRNSDTLTIDYPYTLWSRLVTATKDATTTANIAANSSKVDPQMVQHLRSMIEEAEHMYSERTAERDRIQWMIDELSMMISEINVQLSSAEFSFDGQTLTVMGETTLTAAVEAAGGKAHVSESVTAIFWETTATINADSLRAVGITNPNLLLYVNTASQAPADVPNVIVGDVASRIVLTDVEGEQNANFNCPRPFVAQRITYTRNFKQRTQVGVSRGWETLALPFNVQVIYKEDGTELVPFAANSQDHRTRPFWLKKVYGGELADADAIEAYKPYLLSLPNDPTVYPADYCLSGTVRFISENVTVAETNPETNYLGVNDIAVVPTFSRVEQSDEVYALNVSQELENHAEGSIFEAGLRDVRPFECYTIHTNAGPAPAFMTVADLLSGGLTGITPAVSGLPANDTEAWYTLDGRKLQERPAAKGLYIHQGRKMVVK